MRNKGSVVVMFYQVGKFHTYPFPFLTPPLDFLGNLSCIYRLKLGCQF